MVDFKQHLKGTANMAGKKEETAAPKREHKATYATDKEKGGYLVRVIGPKANKFGERFTKGDDGKPIAHRREIPVTRKDNSENPETLGKLIWSGKDQDTGAPVALYDIYKKPKAEKALDDEIPF